MARGTINYSCNLRKTMAAEMGTELRKWLKARHHDGIAGLEEKVKKKFLEMPKYSNYKDQIEVTKFTYYAEADVGLDRKKTKE